MSSSEVTHEDASPITGYYTTALDALYAVAKEYYTLGKLHEAQRLLTSLQQLLDTGEVTAQQRLKLLLLHGQVLLVAYLLAHGTGDTNELVSTIEHIKEMAETSGTQQDIADALCLLGEAHYFTTVMSGAVLDNLQSGKYDKALAYQQQALQMRETLHDNRGISESYFQIGVIYERWQQYERSEEYYTRARQIADQYNYAFEKTEPARHFAIHALGKGDLDQALPLALQALELREAARFKPYQPLDHLLISEIYQARGDAARAQFHVQQASAIAEEIGHPELVSSRISIRERLATQPQPQDEA